jgi:hypothetical protein
MVRSERGDLVVERVDLVPPAAVQDDDWTTRARVTIVYADRRNAWQQRGRSKLDVRHE